jgi:hypothetical protein
MAANVYKTIKDLERIVTDDLREGLSLEYKSSDILVPNGIKAVCKAISALSNSAGGQFVTGIASHDEKPARLDGGFVGASKLDWIHQVVNSNTYPALEDFDVLEIADGGFYYVVDVPVSPKAPHQSNDNKYYKRRGPHSDPMEHYEIEDVRNRPKAETAPLRVEVVAEGILALLQFSNNDQFSPITDLRCSISANFSLTFDGIKRLNARGLRRLAPNNSIAFHIGGFVEILGANSEAEISTSISYQFKGAAFKHSQALFVGDFESSAITRSPSVRAIEKISERLDKIVDSLRPAKQLAELLEQAIDGSGLRLSKRTLASLQGQSGKFDPSEFDYKGYQIVADISLDDAIRLDRVFGVIGPLESKRARYRELPDELRRKFEAVFEVGSFLGSGE